MALRYSGIHTVGTQQVGSYREISCPLLDFNEQGSVPIASYSACILEV